MGGCVSSTAESKSSNLTNPATKADKTNQVKQQRRRLSVTPKQVGDIDEVGFQRTESQAKYNVGSTPGVDLESGPDFCAISCKGYVPYNRKKQNQDCFFMESNLHPVQEIKLYGVCDGHGEFGHLVSDFVKQNIGSQLKLQSNLVTQPELAIKEAFKQVCTDLDATDINIAFSGTTCVLGLEIGPTMYIANIGDSRCIVVQQTDGMVQAKPLSVDQKPDDPVEKARILRAGGRVEPLPGPATEDMGPNRVWLADIDVPGLAMSRSIGDEISHTVGVISEPEITKYEIQPEDMYIVWASDGVWEFLSNQQVAHMMLEYSDDLQAALHKIIEESTRMWNEVEEVVDDITVVVRTLTKN
jgi:serine/threonine protein phosphatase PrpC